MLKLKDSDGRDFVIVPPGMGITTSKDSLNDERAYQDEIKKIRNIGNTIKADFKNIEFLQKSSKEIYLIP
ncbi:hypothetical protein PAEVO_43310 [Paenibacillus sp. GM2FR]|nr:hypothetical protein PAEVO_43310 [Paenibacillus sp. GM2FR]